MGRPRATEGPGVEVERARARLRRIAGREALAGRLDWVLGSACAAAGVRWWLWRLPEEAPLWHGAARSAAVFALVAGAGAAALVVAGRRRGPSALGAARAMDGALGLREVVASGYALQAEGQEGAFERLAVRRAAEAAAGFDAARAFALPPLVRRWGRAAGWALLALVCCGYDPAVVRALRSPPSAAELAAAASLEAAAGPQAQPQQAPEAAQRSGEKKEMTPGVPSGSTRQRAEATARSAARAAQRGDRDGALAKLSELRSAVDEAKSRADAASSLLRRVAEALPAAGREARGDRPLGDTPQDELRLLARDLKKEGGGSKEQQEALRKMLDRLDRALESEMRRRPGETRGGERLRDALRELSDALGSGNAQRAADLLDQMAERLGGVENDARQAKGDAAAIGRLAREGEKLEKALTGGQGSQGQDGDGDGDGKGDGPGAGQQGMGKMRARMSALGLTRGGGVSEGGGHIPNKGDGNHPELGARGGARARSQLGEGERTVQALSGLGRGATKAPAYKEFFPGYHAAAEEGLADEKIPAARREAVRRYFEGIRPAAGGEGADGKGGEGKDDKGGEGDDKETP